VRGRRKTAASGTEAVGREADAVETRKHRSAQRKLIEAEGYLELGMPQQALEILESTPWEGALEFPGNFLRGLILRDLERHREAIAALESAHRARPDDIDVLLTLGWCLKRADQLPLAIRALEHAAQINPAAALVQYNLACYHALAGDRRAALEKLKRALELEPKLRELVGDETDFDPVRDDPQFRLLLEEKG
jgi:tetratricopeptide (TPR) repeat protein